MDRERFRDHHVERGFEIIISRERFRDKTQIERERGFEIIFRVNASNRAPIMFFLSARTYFFVFSADYV